MWIQDGESLADRPATPDRNSEVVNWISLEPVASLLGLGDDLLHPIPNAAFQRLRFLSDSRHVNVVIILSQRRDDVRVQRTRDRERNVRRLEMWRRARSITCASSPPYVRDRFSWRRILLFAGENQVGLRYSSSGRTNSITSQRCASTTCSSVNDSVRGFFACRYDTNGRSSTHP